MNYAPGAQLQLYPCRDDSSVWSPAQRFHLRGNITSKNGYCARMESIFTTGADIEASSYCSDHVRMVFDVHF